jgi:hypothetical protein
MFKKLLTTVILISAAVLSGCAQYTTVREHKDLQEEAKHISSVIILPADVTVEKLAFTGDNERETDKESAFSQELKDSAKAALEAKGLKVIEFDFANTLASNQNLAYAITQCKESLTKSEDALYKKPTEVKDQGKFSESVGAPANIVAETTGAQSMLIVKYKGFEKTAGMQAKDIAAGVLLAVLLGGNQAQIAASQGASMEAALVATDSGDILWTNRSGGPQLNTGFAKNLFNSLPNVPFDSSANTTQTASATPSTVASDNKSQ